ncbi:hypothetical protein NA655_03430 [Pseudomonas kuykendallii]|uniref:hypothetical protein n=1 Tax=Pseudomonas kuykendallii TaxID=1007099 RepID=UPI001113C910|nr:hypothetical protein [Pseudomonas kuykendallii]MCQ4270068.1 hypothetical protein [Pseudomonas kuykendallii]
MTFTPKEQQVAANYGVRLGAPFKDVKRQLTNSGWSIDKDWLSENAADTKGEVQPVCGNGQDSVCSITFAKGKLQIYLVLSGTNDGLPLISLEEQP